jgi:hypothetical protein
MGRLLELTVFAVFLWLVLESWVARLSGRGRRDPRRTTRGAAPAPRAPAAPPRTAADLTLVRCAACGTHVPESRTIAVSGARYCSERCAGGTPVEKAREGAGRGAGGLRFHAPE